MLVRSAYWLSNPLNQESIAAIGGAAAALIDPNPNGSVDYPGYGDDFVKLFRMPIAYIKSGEKVIPKYANVLFGKDTKGRLEGLADYLGANQFHNFWDVYHLPNAKSFEDLFPEVIEQTIKNKGKIIFDLGGVETSIATKMSKKTFKSAQQKFKATEWELGKILSNPNWHKNTVFTRDGVEVPIKELGKLNLLYKQ